MGIDIMNGFNHIQSYYHRASQIPTVTPEEVKAREAQAPAKAEAEALQKQPVQETVREDTRSRAADLENISLTFNREESYDYLGSESNIHNLDVQKAVSDMRKDTILQDYQYFVGSAKPILDSADGLVFQK